MTGTPTNPFHHGSRQDNQCPDEEHIPHGVVQGEGERAAEGGDQADDQQFHAHPALGPDLIDDHADAVEAAPDHEIPAGTVPQAAQQHGVHGVDVGGDELAVTGLQPGPEADAARQGQHTYSHPPAAAEEAADYGDGTYYNKGAGRCIAVAAQGDVQIVPQPSAQGHMPAAPEFLRAACLVRGVEVLGQVEAEEHGHARGDVRVAGEIGIHLEGIAEQRGKVLEAAVQERVLEDAVGEVHRQVIGQDELLEQAVHDPEDGNSEPSAGKIVRLVQLLDKLHGTHDGTGHQLREEA